jgi:small-conductance mechanosensitive channel
VIELINKILVIPTAFAQAGETTANVTNKTAEQIQGLFNMIIQSLPLWITGLLVIGLSFFLARIAKNAVENKMTEKGLEEEHKEVQIVASRATSAIVLTLGVTAGLKIAGLDLTSIIAAAAFGIGFAMQDIIMNFLAGIIVLLQKQFTIGDWIKVGPTVGIIKEIQSRFTVIRKFDGTKVIIPNSELFKNQVTSLTSNPIRRFQFDLGVDLYVDLKEVIDLIYGSVKKVPRILQSPKPSIVVRPPGAFFNNLRIRCWVDSKKGILKPISELVKQLHQDFYAKGWSWPYPTQNIIFDKDDSPVTARAKNYIEKHKEALEKETNLLERQKQILEQQIRQPEMVKPAVTASAQPVAPILSPLNLQPLPQAQQIGIATPEMEVPVWLQKATEGIKPAVSAQEMPAPPMQQSQPAMPLQADLNIQQQNFPVQSQQPIAEQPAMPQQPSIEQQPAMVQQQGVPQQPAMAQQAIISPQPSAQESQAGAAAQPAANPQPAIEFTVSPELKQL